MYVVLWFIEEEKTRLSKYYNIFLTGYCFNEKK